ncbi:MAG: hypothetical protein J5729_01570 [Bacteroidaceae bacterium]|nr:hypothetical protein [Bacteroidaceae bacterium]MBO4593308.1 hypothetical protein [Bacteroidaceae bacterium]MBR4782371.1 hypothetical protein [Bacteroidaceae bacterium]
MKTTSIIYAFAWLLPITLIVLYLTGTIQRTATLQDGVLTYLLSITTIVLTLLTAWLAMKLFALPVIQKRLSMLSKPQRKDAYNMLCRLRIISVLMVILINFATFYIMGSTSPLYLAAIMAVTLIFCWPRAIDN